MLHVVRLIRADSRGHLVVHPGGGLFPPGQLVAHRDRRPHGRSGRRIPSWSRRPERPDEAVHRESESRGVQTSRWSMRAQEPALVPVQETRSARGSHLSVVQGWRYGDDESSVALCLPQPKKEQPRTLEGVHLETGTSPEEVLPRRNRPARGLDRAGLAAENDRTEVSGR